MKGFTSIHLIARAIAFDFFIYRTYAKMALRHDM
jgi:hypothetical protein